MNPDEVRDALRSYRTANARIAFLREQAEEIRRGIELENSPEVQAIHAQKYTGIPSAYTESVTERLALAAMDGRYTSDAIRWEQELQRLEGEIWQAGKYPRMVDIWLSALDEREKAIVIAHEVDCKSWSVIEANSPKILGEHRSSSAIRSTHREAMQKIFNIAR